MGGGQNPADNGGAGPVADEAGRSGDGNRQQGGTRAGIFLQGGFEEPCFPAGEDEVHGRFADQGGVQTFVVVIDRGDGFIGGEGCGHLSRRPIRADIHGEVHVPVRAEAEGQMHSRRHNEDRARHKDEQHHEKLSIFTKQRHCVTNGWGYSCFLLDPLTPKRFQRFAHAEEKS